MEGGEVSGLHEDHAVVCSAPDVRVLGYYCNILGQFLLEFFPAGCSLFLVRLSQGSDPVKD